MTAKPSITVRNDLFFADVELLIAEGHHTQLQVKGYSMRPFLRNESDSVELAPLPSYGICRGMVVLFRHGGKYILHRVRSVSGHRLRIEGDGNYRVTELARAEDVIAYVVRRIRPGRRPIRYDTLAWRTASAFSLLTKRLRTLYRDIKKSMKSPA